jgi:hypothetical protein
MKRLYPLFPFFLGIISVAAIHMDVDWPLSDGLSDLEHIIIESKTKKNENLISFELSFTENPKKNKNELWALSIFTFGQLEIKDGDKIIAEIEIQGKNIYKDESDFTFSIQEKYVKDSVFILKTYPVGIKEQKTFLLNKWKIYGNDSDNDVIYASTEHLMPPMSGINYVIKLKTLMTEDNKSNKSR